MTHMKQQLRGTASIHQCGQEPGKYNLFEYASSIYSCAVSWRDVDLSTTTSCVAHLILIGMINHSEVKLH
jgi:hypothetical protein